MTAGGVAVVDEVEFRFGGGSVNTPTGTIAQRDVLAFQDATGSVTNYDGFNKTVIGALGTTAKVTNNDFFDNNEAPISVTANGLLAGDPLRPLVSGNPFFRGNVMLRNDVNAAEVIPVPQNRNGTTIFGYPDNLNVDSVWDDTDMAWALRTAIVLEGASEFSLQQLAVGQPAGVRARDEAVHQPDASEQRCLTSCWPTVRGSPGRAKSC